MRVVVEVAAIPVGSLRLPLRLIVEGDADPAGGAGRLDDPLAMPAIHVEGSRSFVSGPSGDAELVAIAPGETPSGPTPYRLDPPGAFDDVRRSGAGDGIEWTLRGRDGIERVLRVVRPGGAQWVVASLRDPTSGQTGAVEYDSSGRLVRIATADGLEWRFDYERAGADAAARLAQVTARTSPNAGSETIYRARLEYGDGSNGARLEGVRAASRAPASAAELDLVYAPPSAAGAGAEIEGGERLQEIRTPRGEVEPRFEYDGATMVAVFSAIPAGDAYQDRYTITARLLPEYVGDDILEDALGRRTMAFDEDARKRHRLRVRGGRLVRSDGARLDTGGSPFMIVLAPDGELYAAQGDYSSDVKVHHSSFLAGAPVAAAGEVVVQDGKVVRVTSRSGHYKPPMCLLDQLRAELERRGVELDGVPFEKGY
jgi:YD repeat-containing protein